MGLPPATALFGRDVVDGSGRHLGRVEMIVRLPDGERQAVVRSGLWRRRRTFVSLDGAVLVNGRVVVCARPAPVLHLHPSPQHPEGEPNRAA